MNYWMVTILPENFGVTREQGFQVQGFGQRQRRKTERMSPGDRLMYYVKEVQVFPLAATITSKAFEDHTLLWHSHRQEEHFAYRVHVRPDTKLEEGRYLDAAEIAPRLEYLRRWPPELWPLAFQGELHLLPRRDFELLEAEMKRVLRRNGGRRSDERQSRRRDEQRREDAPVGSGRTTPGDQGEGYTEPDP